MLQKVKNFAFLVALIGLLFFPLGLVQADDAPVNTNEPIEKLIDQGWEAIVDVVQALWNAGWGAIGVIFDDVVFSKNVGMRVVFILILLATAYVLVQRFIINA